MRILIFGATGMLGHKIYLAAEQSGLDVWACARSSYAEVSRYDLFRRDRFIERVDVSDQAVVADLVKAVHPNVIVNAAGIVKQAMESRALSEILAVNSLFPQLLGRICRQHHVRLVHISSDCVFSGRRGNYAETDVPDPIDFYGITKLLGEVDGVPGCLTLRTSFVGRELQSRRGLVEWLLSHRNGGVVEGYSRAVFSGLTTLALSRIVVKLIVDHPVLSGLYHVAGPPIDKRTLLRLLTEHLSLPITIKENDRVNVDRSLNNARFIRDTGLMTPYWVDMIADLAREDAIYERWRTKA